MKTSSCSAPPTVSDAFTQRLPDWRVYAAAAGGALAAATSAAQASIIYQQLDITRYNGFLGPVIQVDGVQETFVNRNTFDPFGNRTEGSVQFLQGGLKILVDGDNSPYAMNFATSAPIAGNFKNSFGVLNHVRVGLDSNSNIYSGQTTVRGHFGGKTGFVGFQLPNGDNGWLRLAIGSGSNINSYSGVDVIDYAYNDVAGAPINAGQTAPVPEPGSKALALLAFGSAGVLAWRRRQRMKVEG